MKAIMVMYDTLRRDYLSPFNSDINNTPGFEKLSEKAISFDNNYVCSMPCMPARRELHTGRSNFLHRSWGPIEPFDDSMPAILKANGVYSHIVSDHWHYWEEGGSTYHTQYSSWEISRGQEGDRWIPRVGSEINTVSEFGNTENPYTPIRTALRQERINRNHIKSKEILPQMETFNKGIDFIDANHDNDNWFLQIETFDPHEPFYLTPDLDIDGQTFDWPPYYYVRENNNTVTKVRNRYKKLIGLCDESLNRILDKMDEYNLWEDTMLIVNTDHGFMLGEHQWWGKSIMPLYNEIANTPLFVYDPRNKKHGHRDALTQNIDLAPTILDFFKIRLPQNMQGKNLLPVMLNNKQVHNYAIFGIHGGCVNITDGNYVYMVPPVVNPGQALYEYTLMPTHMSSFFTKEEIESAVLIPGSAETKNMPVLKIKKKEQTSPSSRFGIKLYDNINDRKQMTEENDIVKEIELINLLLTALRENQAPSELYGRIGLPENCEQISLKQYENFRRRHEYGFIDNTNKAATIETICCYRAINEEFPELRDALHKIVGNIDDNAIIDVNEFEKILLEQVGSEQKEKIMYYCELFKKTK